MRQVAFVANTATVNFIAGLQDGIHDEATAPGSSITEFHGDPEPTDVTLFLTTACNLRCTYCYASAGDTPLKNMPFKVAQQGIDFILKNAVKKGEQHIEVNFHGGGEPTVNWKVMTESLFYGRRLRLNMIYVLCMPAPPPAEIEL